MNVAFVIELERTDLEAVERDLIWPRSATF